MAAGITYTPIATTTLGSATASVTFSSISGSYTDLVLVISGAIASATVSTQLQFNGDTATNYSETLVNGNGTSTSSARDSNVDVMYAGFINTSIATNIFHIMNYSNTTTYKTVLGRSGPADAGVRATVGLWRSTAAINQVYIYAGGTNFNTGSTFSLYGITAA